MMFGLFFVGLQAPIPMQAMGALSAASAANQLRKASDSFLATLKSGKTLAIRAAVIALIVLLVVTAAKESKFLPGAQQPIEEEGQLDLQTEFVNLLNDSNGDPARLVELMETITSQYGGFATRGIEKIGNSQIARNPKNKEVLRDFFLNIYNLNLYNIEKIFKSKEAASKAMNIFGTRLPRPVAAAIIRTIAFSGLPQTDMEALD